MTSLKVFFKKIFSSNFLICGLLVITLAIAGFTFYRTISLEKGRSLRQEKTKTQRPTTTQNLETTPIPTPTSSSIAEKTPSNLSYESLPFFPNSSELSRESTEGGGVQASYQTQPGITGQEVLNYYENELKNQGWQITLRDKNRQLQALSVDDVQLRVWVYFSGGENEGTIYNVDFRPPGAEAWLPLPVQ